MNRVSFIAFTVIMFFFSSCKQKKTITVSPIIAPITEAVFAPGHIEAAGQFTLTALNDGYITKVLIQEGDTVLTGQIIFVQDNTTAAIQLEAATENLKIAQEQASSRSAVLQQLQTQLDAANAKLQNDNVQLQRMQHLYATHSVAKIDFDNARLNFDNSVSNVAGIQQSIAATKLTLKQTVINSRSQQQTAAVNSNYYQVKSPGIYKVYNVLKKQGELVRKGEALAVLGSSDTLIIALSVDETSIAKIQLLQKVLVELNTEKGETHTARISKIYPSFDAATQAYKAEAVFDYAPDLINGTLLQANIIVAEKDKAMLIPRGCLNPNGKVWIQRGKQTDTVTIQAGIVSNDWVEVLHGVNANDKLIKKF